MKMKTTMLVGHHFAANPLDVVMQCVVDVWELLLQRATVCQRAGELDAHACPQRHSQNNSSIDLNCGHSSGVAVHDRLTSLVVAQSDHHPMCRQRWLQVAARALECCRHQVVGGMPSSFRHEKYAGSAVARTHHRKRQCGTHLVNRSNLLDGAEWWLAHQIHAWATVQWFDDGCLRVILTLLGCHSPTNIVGCGGKPADWSVGGSAAMASLTLGLKSLNAGREWVANEVAATDRAALHAVADPHSLQTFAAMHSSASRCLENHPVCDG
jgi:hypothetical protein